MATALGGSNFTPSEVARTIGTLFDDAMTVEFGHEESAVHYIKVPFFTHQRIAASPVFGERYSDAQRQDYTRSVIAWARAVRADEITVQQYPTNADMYFDDEPGDHPFRIRPIDRTSGRHTEVISRSG